VINQESTVRDLVGRLVYRIEDARHTLHRDEIGSSRCMRLELGLVNSKPEDCDCGLDALLAEARLFFETSGSANQPRYPGAIQL